MSRKSSRPKCPVIRYDDQVEVAVNGGVYEFPLVNSKMGPAHDSSVRKVDPAESARTRLETAQWDELQKNKCCTYRSFPPQIERVIALGLSPNAKNQWVPCSLELKGGLQVEDCDTKWWRTVGEAYIFFSRLGRVSDVKELTRSMQMERKMSKKERIQEEKRERNRLKKERRRERKRQRREASSEATGTGTGIGTGIESVNHHAVEKSQSEGNDYLVTDDSSSGDVRDVDCDSYDLDTVTDDKVECPVTVMETTPDYTVANSTPVAEMDHSLVSSHQQLPSTCDAVAEQIVKILSDKSKIALAPQLNKTLTDIGFLMGGSMWNTFDSWIMMRTWWTL